jgi:hypothetical protein
MQPEPVTTHGEDPLALGVATVRVSGIDYPVIYRDFLHKEEKYGECNLDKQLITIAPDMGIDRTLETILHESLHAIEEAGGFQISEKTLRGFSRGVYALLRDNPQFLKAVLGRA